MRQEADSVGIGVMMKLFGSVLLMTGTSGYGFWKAACYKRRISLLEQLRQMVFLLKGQVLYANATLEEAFEAVGKRTEGQLSRLFLYVAERIKKQQGEVFFTIWKEAVAELLADSELKAEDRQQLTAMGEHLGFLDKDMQERNLLLYLEQLDQGIRELQSHRQERCRLYTSLGVMAGMFLAILLC